MTLKSDEREESHHISTGIKSIDRMINELEELSSSLEELADHYRQFSDAEELVDVFVKHLWSTDAVLQQLENIKNSRSLQRSALMLKIRSAGENF